MHWYCLSFCVSVFNSTLSLYHFENGATLQIREEVKISHSSQSHCRLKISYDEKKNKMTYKQNWYWHLCFYIVTLSYLQTVHTPNGWPIERFSLFWFPKYLCSMRQNYHLRKPFLNLGLIWCHHLMPSNPTEPTRPWLTCHR